MMTKSTELPLQEQQQHDCLQTVQLHRLHLYLSLRLLWLPSW